MLYTSDSKPMGHMTLKSSTLCPNGGKLTSQYLVVDHLVAHYKKLKNVKPHVDTSPPKAWLASQRVRDRIMREALKNGSVGREWILEAISHVNGKRSSLKKSEFDRSDMFSRMLSSQNNANDNLDGTTYAPHKRQDSRLTTSQHFSETGMPGFGEKSSHSARDFNRTSRTGVRNRSQTPKSEAKYTSDSDLIETHRHIFTEGKPFTPRTLRTNMSSKLLEHGYYNPPKRKVKIRGEKEQKPKDVVDHTTEKSLGDTTGFNDTLLTDTMRSYDNRENSTPYDVPPLNISQDLDNLRWLKEQSRLIKAKKIQVLSSEPAVTSEVKQPLAKPSTKTSSAHQKQPLSASDDEELLYLNFIQDVTCDILNRGIFTNRALKQVFESHVEKHEDKLKLGKMQDMIKDLRTNLGIPERDEEEDEGFGFGSSQKLTNSQIASSEDLDTPDSLMMTRQAFDPKQFRLGRRGSRGLGLTLNSRPALHDVQEVQEDDLSGESSRIGGMRKKKQGTGEGSDNEVSAAAAAAAVDTFRTDASSTLDFDDDLAYRSLGATQVIKPKDPLEFKPNEDHAEGQLLEGAGKSRDSWTKGVGKSHSKSEERGQMDEVDASERPLSGQESSARKKRRNQGLGSYKLTDADQGQNSSSSTPFGSPKHKASHSPEVTKRSLESEAEKRSNSPKPKENSPEPKIRSLRSDQGSPKPKPRSPKHTPNSPEPKPRSPKPNSNSPEPNPRSPKPNSNSPEPKPRSLRPEQNTPLDGSRDQNYEMHSHLIKENEGAKDGTAGNLGGEFDDESSLLDTLGEYKHSLEITDNYDDDYDDDDDDYDEGILLHSNSSARFRRNDDDADAF